MSASPRVVSLVASATEIVCALGGEPWLVGRSHECDHPPSVLALPRLTGPRFDISGTSAEIDARVRSLATAVGALSLYEVDAAALAAARPDVILTQVQCEVCAVSAKDVELARAASEVGIDARVVALAPDSLAAIRDDVRRVAAALGVPERGAALVREIDAGFARVAASVADRARARVVCLEWLDPPMAAGNWIPELVEIAGGRDLLGKAAAHSGTIPWGDLFAAAPDVIVLMACGWDVARTMEEIPALAARPGWGDLPAVRAGRVAVVDANAFMTRPGPRVAESAEILAEIFHGPDVSKTEPENTTAVGPVGTTAAVKERWCWLAKVVRP